MVINLAWPRAEIFDPAGEMPILKWAGPICIVASILIGIACFPHGKKHPMPVKVFTPAVRRQVAVPDTERTHRI